MVGPVSVATTSSLRFPLPMEADLARASDSKLAYPTCTHAERNRLCSRTILCTHREAISCSDSALVFEILLRALKSGLGVNPINLRVSFTALACSVVLRISNMLRPMKSRHNREFLGSRRLSSFLSWVGYALRCRNTTTAWYPISKLVPTVYASRSSSFVRLLHQSIAVPFRCVVVPLLADE